MGDKLRVFVIKAFRLLLTILQMVTGIFEFGWLFGPVDQARWTRFLIFFFFIHPWRAIKKGTRIHRVLSSQTRVSCESDRQICSLISMLNLLDIVLDSECHLEDTDHPGPTTIVLLRWTFRFLDPIGIDFGKYIRTSVGNLCCSLSLAVINH
jgi:hypothetical protein